jgi:quinol monooxygenase YgiN
MSHPSELPGTPCSNTEVYVSITGLELRGLWHYPTFMFHAVRSMAQARSAPGNLSADARTIEGIHHTLSVWRDRQAMRTYLGGGAHLEAMKAFRKIATGKTLGYLTDTPPGWDEARALWREKGKLV